LLNKAEQAEQIIPIEPEMVVIPSGSYRRRVDSVNIDSFTLSKYEVTFEEYDLFTDATGRERADDEGWGRGRLPVINITWEDAVAYTHWLSDKTGKTYRLPSEAEWRYASGVRSIEVHRSFSDDIKVNGATCGDGQTAPVGSFSANRRGLHDMLCNVSEWMQDDWYDNRHWACGVSWGDDPFSLFWEPCLSTWLNSPLPITGFRIARSFQLLVLEFYFL